MRKYNNIKLFGCIKKVSHTLDKVWPLVCYKGGYVTFHSGVLYREYGLKRIIYEYITIR